MRLYSLDMDGTLTPSIPLRRTGSEATQTPPRVCLDLADMFIPLDREWAYRIVSLVAERRKEEPGFKPQLFNADLGPNWTLIPSNGSDDRVLLVIDVMASSRLEVPQCTLQTVCFGLLEGSSKVHQGAAEGVVVLAPGTGCLVVHPAVNAGDVRLIEVYYSHTRKLSIVRSERAQMVDKKVRAA